MRRLFFILLTSIALAACSDRSESPSAAPAPVNNQLPPSGEGPGGIPSESGSVRDENGGSPDVVAGPSESMPSQQLTWIQDWPLDIMEATSVAVDPVNNRAYVATGFLGIMVVDLSRHIVIDRLSLSQDASRAIWVAHIVFQDGKIYATGPEGFLIIDPESKEVKNISLDGDPQKFDMGHRFRIYGNKAYVLAGKTELLSGISDLAPADLSDTSKIYIVDLTTEQVTSFPHYSDPEDLEIANGIAYVTQANGIHHDTAGAHDGTNVGDRRCARPKSVAWDGDDRLFVACDGASNGLMVLEGIRTRQPRVARFYDKIHDAQVVKYVDGLVYVAASSASLGGEVREQSGSAFGLYIVDPAKADAQAVQAFPGIGQVTHMAIAGRKLLITTHNGSCDLTLLDLDSKITSRVCGISDAMAVAATPDRLYVGTDTEAYGLKIVNRTDGTLVSPAGPKLVTQVETIGDAVYFVSAGSMMKMNAKTLVISNLGEGFRFAVDGQKVYVLGKSYTRTSCLAAVDPAAVTAALNSGYQWVEGIPCKDYPVDLVLTPDSIYVMTMKNLKRVKRSDLTVTEVKGLGDGTLSYGPTYGLHIRNDRLYVKWRDGVYTVPLSVGAATKAYELEGMDGFFVDGSGQIISSAGIAENGGAIEGMMLKANLTSGIRTLMETGVACQDSVSMLFGYRPVGVDDADGQLFVSGCGRLMAFSAPL